MDFGFSDEQESLRESLRDFFRGKMPVARSRAALADAGSVDEKAWADLSALGWAGLNVPEAFGGAGLGVLELALAMEEAGAVVLSAPMFSASCLGIPAIDSAAGGALREAWLTDLATGSKRVTAAWCESDGSWGPTAVLASAEPASKGYRIQGRKLFVPDLEGAAGVVLPTRMQDGVGLFLVDPAAPGCTVRRMQTIDGVRNFCEFSFDTVVEPSALLGDGAAEDAVLARMFSIARIGAAAEMAGCARASLALSVEYAKIREQFGRPIGSFQAVQHKCADMAVAVENALSLVYFAAWAADCEPDRAPKAAAAAKAYAGEACMKVCEEAVQVHGGIGFTWEHDLQLYFKRVRTAAACHGDSAAGYAEIAAELGI